MKLSARWLLIHQFRLGKNFPLVAGCFTTRSYPGLQTWKQREPSVLYPFLFDPGNFELINYQAAAMGRNKFLEPSHLSPPLSLNRLFKYFCNTLRNIFVHNPCTTTINELEIKECCHRICVVGLLLLQS